MRYTADNPLIYFPCPTLEDFERKENKKENIHFKLLRLQYRKENKETIIFFHNNIAIPRGQSLQLR